MKKGYVVIPIERYDELKEAENSIDNFEVVEIRWSYNVGRRYYYPSSKKEVNQELLNANNELIKEIEKLKEEKKRPNTITSWFK